MVVGQAFRNALRRFLLHRRHRFVAVDPGQVGAQLRQSAQHAVLAPADESLEQLIVLTFAKHPLQGGLFSAHAGGGAATAQFGGRLKSSAAGSATQ